MTDHFFGDFPSFLPSPLFHPGVLLLVPNALVRKQITEEMLERSPVVLGPRVKTFKSLEFELLRELDLRLVGYWERIFRLNALAPRLWEPLGLPGGFDPALVAALAEQLGDGLDRLRLSGVGWERLEALEPESLSKAMAAVGRDYEQWLGEADDTHGARRRLLKRLSDPQGEDFVALKGVARVICARSQRLSPFEAELLKALASRVKVELRMSAPAWLLEERITHLSGWSRLRLIKDLEASAPKGLSVIWSDSEAESSEGLPEALRYASDNLFGPPPAAGPPPIDGALSILEVPTRYHEVEEIGRRLKKLLAEGAQAHRLAVAVPNMREWVPAFEDVSRRFGLPMTLRRGRDIRDQGVVRAFLDLLGLWGSRLELKRVLKVFESPYFALGLPDGWRPALLEAGVLDDRAEGGYVASLKRIKGEREAAILGSVAEVLDRLKKYGELLIKLGDWLSFRNSLQTILVELRWPNQPAFDPFAKNIGLGQDGEDLRAEALALQKDKAALDLLAEVLKKLFEGLLSSPDAPKASLPAFKTWLEKALSGLSVPEPPSGLAGVEVMDYYELHGARFDVLFLAGLNDRVFPAPTAEPCWWPESFIEGLLEGSLGRRLWSDAAETYQTREAMVAQALSQASKVVLSYHLAKDDGQRLLPSPLLESLKGLFPEGELQAERPGWPLPPKPERISDPGELFLSLAAREDGLEPPEALLRLYPAQGEARRLWRDMLIRRARLNLRLAALPEANLKAWLSTLDRYDGKPLVSLGLLTGYRDCPRKFLLGELLGLSRWPEPEEEWGPADWGEVLHKTLELYLRPMIGQALRPPNWSRLSYIFWEQAHRRSCRRPMGRKLVWEAQARREEERLKGWLERQKPNGGVILELEWSFKPGGDAPPLVIDTNQGPLALEGRVDKIERQNGQLVVTDYKRTRSSRYKEAPSAEKRQPWEHQLVLYGLAAKSGYKGLKPKDAGGGGPVAARVEFIDPRNLDPVAEVPLAEPSLLAGLWEAIHSRGLGYADNEETCKACGLRSLCAEGA